MALFSASAKFKFGPPDNHIMAVINKMIDHIFQVQLHRTAFYQSNIVDTERSLQVRYIDKAYSEQHLESASLFSS